ncbi:sodium:proton antiporter [Mixta theicola]|uniref:Sodium:proton antiporter n=1 Tax=Mixta theicola TaxID=1458355 RepID=A0A2K1Q9Q0_9GAMM|nr:cation:proton antiporter [Mixta theicola]PNS11754.1 sodium:proton antiporter [Mixta theicola]GLR07671.1 sodium:proton antiporter [Mixta theicola]
MDFLAWTATSGGLLLIMSLASGWIHRGPVTSFGLFLLIGILFGPWVLNFVTLDLLSHPDLTAHITEITMAASLFITGLKLRLPLKFANWRDGILLAFPAMLLTVLGMMLVIHLVTGFSWPLSLAFAAIIAPTDPVLASLISVSHAGDDDALRVALSSEAGLNDGSALPLLMLALLLLHNDTPFSADLLGHWLAKDVLWAIGMGALIGYSFGRLIGVLATRLRSVNSDTAPNDFLALALIAISYASAQYVDASGFLAAFAAGVGLRHAEIYVVRTFPPEQLPKGESIPPAEVLVNPNQRHMQQDYDPAHSVGLVVGDALSFGDTVERLLAALMVVVLGVTLALHWNSTGLLLAAILFLIIRPLAIWLATIGTGIPFWRRILIGWLGIRGIGSINYIAYAWVHGMTGPQADAMVDMALTLVVASVVIHGITVTPLLNRRQAWQQARHKAEEEKQREEQARRE